MPLDDNQHRKWTTSDTPRLCECGTPLTRLWTIVEPCATGKCDGVSCINCGKRIFSVGPVDCSACGGLNLIERIAYRFLVWVRSRR